MFRTAIAGLRGCLTKRKVAGNNGSRIHRANQRHRRKRDDDQRDEHREQHDAAVRT